jgi:hypothetical protein
MKRLPILKWCLIGLLFLVLMLIGLLITVPIAYFLRRSITNDPKKYWNHFGLYWFTDDSEGWGSTEEIIYLNNWYGVYEIYNYDYEGFKKLSAWKKFWWNYRWMGLRNPHWNFKRKMSPIAGDKHSVNFKINTITPARVTPPGEEPDIDWLNESERGVMFGYFEIEDEKFFRYSHIINFTLFGKRNWLFELGTRHVGQSRYAAKSKFRKVGGEFT